MYMFFRVLIYFCFFGILLFLSIRFIHFNKYRNRPTVDVLLNKKYCLSTLKGKFPIHSYPDDNLCLIKGVYISPGLFKDNFYLPRPHKQNIHLNNVFIVNYY